MKIKEHIDKAQPSTVEEHFELIINDKSIIDSVPKEVSTEDLPEWFDEKLFKKGQAYYMRNILQMSAANLTGLIAILSVPETLDVLIFTKQSSNVCSAFRRYAQTLLHIFTMHKSDILDSKSKYYRSLNVIRWKHAIACGRSMQAGIAGIYQRDMVITQFGFIGYALIAPEALALTNTPDESEAYNHFWRVTGHLLGIPDRMNLCRKNAAETTELCQRVAKDILRKYMDDADERYIELVECTLKGTWHIDIALDPDALMTFTYRLTGLEYKKPLSWYSWLNYKYRTFVMYLLKLPIIGPIRRTYHNIELGFLYWVLEKYPVYAYMFLGKEKTKLCLYPKIKYT